MLFLCFRMPFLHLANSDSTSGPQSKYYFFRDTFHEPQDGAMSPCYGVWQSPLFFVRALMTVMIVILSSRMWCNVIIRFMPKSHTHTWSSKLVKSQKPGHPCLWTGASRHPLSRWVMNGQIFMIKIYYYLSLAASVLHSPVHMQASKASPVRKGVQYPQLYMLFPRSKSVTTLPRSVTNRWEAELGQDVRIRSFTIGVPPTAPTAQWVGLSAEGEGDSCEFGERAIDRQKE